MKIETSYVFPPIPSRNFDWQAIDGDTYDGAPDSSTRNQVGHGATEQEAIEDLLDQTGAEAVNCLQCGKLIHYQQGTCPHCGYKEF